ncbi:apolipoprotein N-acyltransferase [Kineococcus radiotolerans]
MGVAGALARVGMAAAGGLSAWMAFPGAVSRDGWWPSAAVAVTFLIWATRSCRPRAAAGLGFVFALAFLIPHLRWSGIYVGAVPWLALAAVCAAFYAFYAAFLPGLLGAGRWWNLLAVAGGWVLLEAARSRVPFGGFPWARLAFSQVDGPILGWARVGGAPLVTFTVALVGALLATFATMLGRILRARRALLPVDVFSACLPLVVAVVVCASGLLIPRPVEPDITSVDIAAVQGNTPRPGLDFNAERRAVLTNHVSATQSLAESVARGESMAPDLVFWPENSSDIDPYQDPAARASIEAVTRAIDAPVLIGAVLEGPGRYLSNTGLVVTPQLGLEGAASDAHRNYVKRRPAPFAEYVPYRSFFRTFSDKVDLVRRDFLPGQRGGTVLMGDTRVGDVICFEVAFDGLVRDSVRSGAQMLVVQTNNATFGYSDEAVQQLAMSRFRAVETGRAVVQISTVGVSSIISPDGSAPVRTELFTQAVLQGRVPLRSDQTLATRLGSLPEAALSTAVLFPLLLPPLLPLMRSLRGSFRDSRRRLEDLSA